jgi:hypothetical protein
MSGYGDYLEREAERLRERGEVPLDFVNFGRGMTDEHGAPAGGADVSNIYERPVTRSWTEFSIKVRSLTIGELQLLARWLINKVGEERAELANAVRFEVRGDDDEAELVAIVEDGSRRHGSFPARVAVTAVLDAARAEGEARVNTVGALIMLDRIKQACGAVASDVRGSASEAVILGARLRTDQRVPPDCIRVGRTDYILVEGETDALALPGYLVSSAPSSSDYASDVREALDDAAAGRTFTADQVAADLAARRDETGSTQARP